MNDKLLSDLGSRQIEGDIIDPRHDHYDRARCVWNGMADRRPARPETLPLRYLKANEGHVGTVAAPTRPRQRAALALTER